MDSSHAAIDRAQGDQGNKLLASQTPADKLGKPNRIGWEDQADSCPCPGTDCHSQVIGTCVNTASWQSSHRRIRMTAATRSRRHRKVARRVPYRLQLERLEDRVLLATFLVNSRGDEADA